MGSDACIYSEDEKVSRVKRFPFFLLLTLLFPKWTSLAQQLTTMCSHTVHTKETQVSKWLSYLASINAKLHDPSSKDHFLPLTPPPPRIIGLDFET